MKKLFRFLVIFGLVTLMLWMIPHFGTAVSAPESLTIAKSDGISQVIAGDGIAYHYLITVTNMTGSSPARPVVTDTWPVGFTRGAVVASRGSCVTTNPNDFTCSLGNMPGGARAIITATYTVPAGTPPGSYTNLARSAATGVPSPNPVVDTNTVLAVANLGISKSDGLSQVTAGDSITHHYAITVTNSGPSLATSVLVTDTWPVGFTRGTVNRSQGSCNTTDPNNFTCTLGNLAVGSRATITATYTVPAATSPGIYTNQVHAKSPVSSLVNASDADNVVLPPNLGITKSDGVTSVVAGDGVVRSYVITVNNPGPLIASSVLMTDTWPVGLTRGTVNRSQGTCNTTNPNDFTCSLGSIPVGSRATITATYTVPSTTTPGIYTNQGRAKTPVGSLVTASDANTVSAAAVLGILKSDTLTQIIAGDGITHRYAITVTNSGPSLATGVLVTDTWPVAFTRGTVSRSQGTCNTTNPNNFTCSLGSIPVGSRATITATYTVPSTTSPGIYTNQARAKSPVSSLVSASDADNVSASANLGITKSDNLAQVVAGDGITHRYAITVTNSGPSLATSMLITDTWPVGFTRGLVSKSQGTCNTTNPNNFTCALSSLAVGSRATITATYTVPSTTSPGVSTNSVTVRSAATDPNSSNNSASDQTTVATSANLSLSMNDNPDPVVAGNYLTYTLQITNPGPSLAVGVAISDTLPTGLTFISSGSSLGCAANGQTITCSLGNLFTGANRQVVILSLVNPALSGLITNRARVTSGTFDPDLANNLTQIQTTVLVPDSTPPTVSWVAPGVNEQQINVGCQIVHFLVTATDNVGVQRVNFYWWDPFHTTYIDIGTDYSAPYDWDFFTDILYIDQNQIFAKAYDLVGNPSIQQRIILKKTVNCQHYYLPTLLK